MDHPPRQTAAAPARRPRDPRLDFFRGLAMFIILLAHTPGNAWTLWIPARFGFSDATEIFVFCSGMASALAFGAVFANRGFLLGTARIGFRVWQVYWAHVGVFLVTAAMLFAIDHFGVGNRETPYIHEPYVVPLFERTGEALIGLLTLTYVPGLFDILPMYLVILAMIPAVMAAHRIGGRWAVFALMGLTWTAANLAGWARRVAEAPPDGGLGAFAARLGAELEWMNLPSYPWGDATWFFNPFGWQIVFFTGFAFGMGWLPAPPVRRWLVALAVAVLVLSLPIAWHKLYAWKTGYLPETWGGALFWDLRERLEPLYWKSWQGVGRFAHFLALAYLAWAAVGPGGARLIEGWHPPRPASRGWFRAALAVALLTVPATYGHELGALFPVAAAALAAFHAGLEGGPARALLDILVYPPEQRIGLLHLAHLASFVVAAWTLLPEGWRRWLLRDAWLAAIPVIRKVGTQSLAVFMVSIPLARANGWLMDLIGRDVWTVAAVNLFGFAILIGVAYLVSWLKRQPWRDTPARPAAVRPAAGGERAAATPGHGASVSGAAKPLPAGRA